MGKGGMGEVYLVEDKLRDNLQLALKILYASTITSAHLEFFKYEFKILTELAHPNLVRVFDYGTTGSEPQHFFTSEFVNGTDLLKGTEQITLEGFYDIFIQILRGLAYIHSRGLVHHDIKVNNILVTNSTPPVVKIVDFGLVGEEKVPTEREANTVRGTVSYLAPECIRQKQVDHRIDLYALGITLYFILARRLPFQSQSATEVLRQHLLTPPTPLREHNPMVPAELERVVFKLMEKNREKRYLNANQVLEDLSKITKTPFEIETKETTESYILSGKFVGREEELRELQETSRILLNPQEYEQVENTRELPPPVIFLKGAAGMGKSRLLKEFKIDLQLNQYNYFSGEATSGINQAYQPFLGVFKSLVPLILERDSQGARKILQKFGPQLVRLIPEFGPAYDLQSETTGDEKLDKTKQRDFLAYFLLEAARIQPMVISLDSLQWADEETFDLIENLADTLLFQRQVLSLSRQEGYPLPEKPLSPLLICGNFRGEEAPEGRFERLVEQLEKKGALKVLNLEGLKVEMVNDFIHSMLSSAENIDDWIQSLTRSTAGNPYFIEQILIYLAEEKKIYPKGNRWFISSKDISSALPQSLQEVLGARLDRLDDHERDILRKLSLHKEEVTLPLFHFLSGMEEEKIHALFRSLEKKQILQREQKEQEFVYDFLHGLTREKIYQDIPLKERSDLHYQFGLKLEEYAALKKEDRPEEIAYHFLNSPSTEKAIQYALLAGDKNRRLFANREAFEYYRQGLSLAKKHHPEKSPLFLFKMGEIYTLWGSLKKSKRVYEEISGLVEALPTDRVRARREIADLLKKEGKAPEAMEIYELCIEEMKELEEPLELGKLYYSLAEVYLDQGKAGMAQEALEKSLELLRGPECKKERAQVLNGLAILVYRQGKVERAIAYHEESLALRKELGDKEMIAITLLNLGAIYYEKGRVQEAMDRWKESLEIRRQQGNRLGIATVYECLAHCFSMQSNYEKALKFHQKSLDITEKMGAMRTAGQTYTSLAFVHCFLCQWKEAYQYAQKAQTIFSKANLKRSLVLVHVALATIHYHIGDMEKALENAQEAYEMAQASQFKDGKAQGSLLLATLNREQGKLEEAEKYFEEARELYKAYEDPYSLTFFWIEEALLHLEKEEMIPAKEALGRVRDALGDIVSKWSLVKYHYTAAQVYEAEKNWDTALQCLKKSSQIARLISAKEYLWKSHSKMAEIYIEKGDKKKAQASLVSAMETIREIWKDLPDEFKKIYLEHQERQKVKALLERVVKGE